MFNKLRFKNFKRILQLLSKPEKKLKGARGGGSHAARAGYHHTAADHL